MTTNQEIREKLIKHYRAHPGVTPHYSTIHSGGYAVVHPVFEELFAEGILENRKVPSKSGKTMQWKIFLTESAAQA